MPSFPPPSPTNGLTYIPNLPPEMSPSSGSLRQRQQAPPSPTSRPRKPSPLPSPTTSTPLTSTLLDALRALTLLLLLSSALSYYITGTSLIWRYPLPPSLSQLVHHPQRTLRRYWTGPLLLAPPELLLYNGTTPTLPIYLAIKHKIYDVSVAPTYYGPHGAYHSLAGRDGARAFVSGCFGNDVAFEELQREVVWDLEGVERVFVPFGTVEEEELDREVSAGERERVTKVWEEARRKVGEEVEGWERMLGERYEVVGRVVGWEDDKVGKGRGKGRRGVCEKGERARPGWVEAHKEG